MEDTEEKQQITTLRYRRPGRLVKEPYVRVEATPGTKVLFKRSDTRRGR